MIHTQSLLAETGAVEAKIITGLAVAGGFCLGFLITGLVVRGTSKFVFHKKSPERLVYISKIIGGAAGAMLVYFLISGEGGLGFGGKGRGDSQNAKNGDAESKDPSKNDKPERKKPKFDPSEKKPESRQVESITVYVLGANSKDGRFFRLGDSTDLTLERLLEKIEPLAQQIEESAKQNPNKEKRIEIKADPGVENTSIPQSSKLLTALRERYLRRGFKIDQLETEANGDSK